MMRILLSVFGVAALGLTASAQSGPSAAELAARAATYVERFAGRISGIVVEESYVQDVATAPRLGYRTQLPRGPVHRELKSDLLLVRPLGVESWMQFRDVFEVDGKTVRDRNNRLQKIFLEPSKTTAQQADRIVRESARYNIGDIERTINLPLFGLTILDRRVQQNFRFRLDDGKGGGSGFMALPKRPEFAPPEGAAVLAFEETGLQTLIRTPQGKNLAAKGRFWISPDKGEVLMSELRVDDWTLGAAVYVVYSMNEAIGFPIPTAMHEMFENRTGSTRVQGLATYSNLREFSVKVDEQLAPDKSDK